MSVGDVVCLQLPVLYESMNKGRNIWCACVLVCRLEYHARCLELTSSEEWVMEDVGVCKCMCVRECVCGLVDSLQGLQWVGEHQAPLLSYVLTAPWSLAAKTRLPPRTCSCPQNMEMSKTVHTFAYTQTLIYTLCLRHFWHSRGMTWHTHTRASLQTHALLRFLITGRVVTLASCLYRLCPKVWKSLSL